MSSQAANNRAIIIRFNCARMCVSKREEYGYFFYLKRVKIANELGLYVEML